MFMTWLLWSHRSPSIVNLQLYVLTENLLENVSDLKEENFCLMAKRKKLWLAKKIPDLFLSTYIVFFFPG